VYSGVCEVQGEGNYFCVQCCVSEVQGGGNVTVQISVVTYDKLGVCFIEMLWNKVQIFVCFTQYNLVNSIKAGSVISGFSN